MHVPHTQAITKFQTRQLSSYLCKAMSTRYIHTQLYVWVIGTSVESTMTMTSGIAALPQHSFCNKMKLR